MKLTYETIMALLNDDEKDTVIIDGKPEVVVNASGLKKMIMLSGHPDGKRIYETLMKQARAMGAKD
jgi:hydroxylamine reductase (hybrid-cluster protein)